MYPKLFGFLDSYVLMIILGVAAAFFVVIFYLIKKCKAQRNEIIDILLCAIVAVLAGVIFACLFENLYEFIQDPKTYKWTWGLTFYGGLFGGVAAFLLMYFFFYKRHHDGIIKKILICAPAAITVAHAIGRIGCFLDGCCYGKPTDSWIGVKFPHLAEKVIPTQLIEAIFLFLLFAILMVLIFVLNFRYTFPVYMISYAIFRFIIEFYRGDERGAFIGIFSPSQIWCMILFAGGIALIFIYKYVIFKDGNIQEK